eukprot:765539-Hanusia_phi.AAC.3
MEPIGLPGGVDVLNGTLEPMTCEGALKGCPLVPTEFDAPEPPDTRHAGEGKQASSHRIRHVERNARRLQRKGSSRHSRAKRLTVTCKAEIRHEDCWPSSRHEKDNFMNPDRELRQVQCGEIKLRDTRMVSSHNKGYGA